MSSVRVPAGGTHGIAHRPVCWPLFCFCWALPRWRRTCRSTSNCRRVAAPTQHVAGRPTAGAGHHAGLRSRAGHRALSGARRGAARAKSDAYTNGGYVWGLVDLLYGLVMAAVLLWLQAVRPHARLGGGDAPAAAPTRPCCMARSMFPPSRWLSLPLSIYEGFVREHAYGLVQPDISWHGWGISPPASR